MGQSKDRGRSPSRVMADSSASSEDTSERSGGEELKESDLHALARLGERAAAIAHGLKNAIHALRGLTAIIERKVSEGGDPLEAIRVLRATMEHLEEFSCVSFDKSASGGCEGPGHGGRMAGDVNQSIDWVTEQVSAAFPLVKLSAIRPADVPPVSVPGAVMREVLLSLVLNAAQAMGQKGEMQLEARLLAGQVEIRLQDHGLGIPERDLPRLFQPGFTTKDGGSGLGLYLARTMLRRHGGDVTVGLAIRGGAEFLVRVPLGGGCHGKAIGPDC